jgi:hypothetical protein
LVSKQGEIGQLLQLMARAESGDLPAVATLLTELQLSASQFSTAHLQAHLWMLGITREPTGGGDD